MSFTMNVEVSYEEIENMGFVSENFVEENYVPVDSMEEWAEENYMDVHKCIDYIADNSLFDELAGEACNTGTEEMVKAFIDNNVESVVAAISYKTSTIVDALFDSSDEDISNMLYEIASRVDKVKKVIKEVSEEVTLKETGWDKDGVFIVVEEDSAVCLAKGDIVKLVEDDNSYCPKYKRISDGFETYFYNHLLEPKECTPFEAMGWNKDTILITKSGNAIPRNMKVKLDFDDNTARPSFLQIGKKTTWYIRLEELEVYVETPFDKAGYTKDTLFLDNHHFDKPTLLKLLRDDGTDAPFFYRVGADKENLSVHEYYAWSLDSIGKVHGLIEVQE